MANVSGSANPTATMQLPIVRITRDPLDGAYIRSLEQAIINTGVGGIVTFEGVVRDNARGKRVRALEYDAYPEMAEQELARISAEVERRWQTNAIALVHRIGRLELGECSVVVIVACPHRAEAFEACRYAIDTLKTSVPIWKKEIGENGEEWVEG
ncbi:MAG TPA: molybdenum cofactor biosynthesis protein MoaE [Ktedonobacterales bacterium]|nr:molybdenum cofactor biosynthesis protein MoaE [Ktedonobacterales bacterium]